MKVTFRTFWHGAPPKLMYWACMRSFVNRGHELQLFSYDDIAAPEGVVHRDAAEIVDRELLFAFDNEWITEADYAPFADLFRLKLLYEKGGWWCDLDTFCLSDEFPDTAYAWAREYPEELGGKIGNGQLAIPAGEEAFNTAYLAGRQRIHEIINREDLGANLLSGILAKLGEGRAVYGSLEEFYPIGWIDSFMAWVPKCRDLLAERTAKAVFFPVYQSLSAYMGFDYDILPPESSFLDGLYASNMPERMDGPRYSGDEVLTLVRTWFYENRRWAIDELAKSAGEEAVRMLGLHVYR